MTEVTCRTAAETIEIGRKLGSMLRSEDVVGLTGPLGVGKTAFVSGVAQGMKIDPRFAVTSPTYVFAHLYKGETPLHHIDLYRVESEKELRGIGLEEMIGGEGAAVIEWFDRYPHLWTGDRIEISFSFGVEESRVLAFKGVGKRGGELERGLKGSS